MSAVPTWGADHARGLIEAIYREDAQSRARMRRLMFARNVYDAARGAAHKLAELLGVSSNSKTDGATK